MEFFVSFAKWYLAIGLALNVLAGVSLVFQGGNPRWRALLFGFILNMLTSPIVLAGLLIWFMVDPPTGDPDDLVYSRLSFHRGKTAKEIEREIRAARKSLGPFLIYNVLDNLEEQGLARSAQQQDGRWHYFRAGGKPPTKRSRARVFLDQLIPIPIHNVSYRRIAP